MRPSAEWQSALTASDVMHICIRGSGILEDLSAGIVPPHRLEEQRGPTKVQEAIHHPRCKQTGPCGGRASPKASLPSPKDLSRSTKTKQCRRLKQTNQCSKGEGKITTPKQQRDHPRPVHTPHPPAPGQRYCQGTSRSGLSRGVYRLPVSDHLCHRTHRFRKKKMILLSR